MNVAISPWASHQCLHVPGAANARARARAHAGLCTSASRCLLESDGTLDIVAAGNLSSNGQYDITSFSSLPINETELGIEELATALENPTTLKPSLDISNASNPAGNALYNCSNSETSAIGFSGCNASYDSAPTPQLDPASQIRPDPGSSFLNCPCNCTYVSSACCLSDLVWEDPSFQIVMASPPANATVSCDEGSGEWVSKTKTAGVHTADAVTTSLNASFDDLGSVQYTSPPAAATFWPRTNAA